MRHILASLAVLVAFTAVAGAQDTTAAPVKPDSVAKPTPDTVAKPKPDTTPKPVHIASPYQDFNQLQAFQLNVGYFAGNTGDAGVGPQGAPIANLSYGLHLGGAAFGFGTIGYTNSKRTVLDAALPARAARHRHDLGSADLREPRRAARAHRREDMARHGAVRRIHRRRRTQHPAPGCERLSSSAPSSSSGSARDCATA